MGDLLACKFKIIKPLGTINFNYRMLTTLQLQVKYINTLDNKKIILVFN